MLSLILSCSELISCQAVSVNNSSSDNHKSKRAQHYIELCLNLQDAVKRPRVRCINEEMAQRAARHVSSLNHKKKTVRLGENSFYN